MQYSDIYIYIYIYIKYAVTLTPKRNIKHLTSARVSETDTSGSYILLVLLC